MTSVIYASRLIRTAEKLAGVGAGPGRPALTDLRRATSTAYYAVFHQIIRHGAIDVVPCANEEVLATVTRWYTHTSIRKTAGLVITAAGPKPLNGVGKDSRDAVLALRTAAGVYSGRTFPQDLIAIADAFPTLQDARHSADYDGNYDPVRAVTKNHIADAKTSLRSATSLWDAGRMPDPTDPSDNAAYRTFLRLAMLNSGGPKAR